MTCKRCKRFNECAIEDGTTRFYGKEVAANNVEQLCPIFAEKKHNNERFPMIFRSVSISDICRDLHTILKDPRYKIISTNMAVNNGEMYVLVFFEREGEE